MTASSEYSLEGGAGEFIRRTLRVLRSEAPKIIDILNCWSSVIGHRYQNSQKSVHGVVV